MVVIFYSLAVLLGVSPFTLATPQPRPAGVYKQTTRDAIKARLNRPARRQTSPVPFTTCPGSDPNGSGTQNLYANFYNGGVTSNIDGYSSTSAPANQQECMDHCSTIANCQLAQQFSTNLCYAYSGVSGVRALDDQSPKGFRGYDCATFIAQNPVAAGAPCCNYYAMPT